MPFKLKYHFVYLHFLPDVLYEFVEFGKLGTKTSIGDELIPNCINTIKYVKKLAKIEVSKDFLTVK